MLTHTSAVGHRRHCATNHSILSHVCLTTSVCLCLLQADHAEILARIRALIDDWVIAVSLVIAARSAYKPAMRMTPSQLCSDDVAMSVTRRCHPLCKHTAIDVLTLLHDGSCHTQQYRLLSDCACTRHHTRHRAHTVNHIVDMYCAYHCCAHGTALNVICHLLATS